MTPSDPLQDRATALIGLIVSFGIVRYRSAYCIREQRALQREAELKLEEIRSALTELIGSADATAPAADQTKLSKDLLAQINAVHGELYKRRETVDFLRGVDAMALSTIEHLQSKPQPVAGGES